MKRNCHQCLRLRCGDSTPCLFLLCQITNLDYDEHKGRISIGRISSGAINRAQQVAYLKPGELLSWMSHRRRALGTSLPLQAAGRPASCCVSWQPSRSAESQVDPPLAHPRVHKKRSPALSLGTCRVPRPLGS